MFRFHWLIKKIEHITNTMAFAKTLLYNSMGRTIRCKEKPSFWVVGVLLLFFRQKVLIMYEVIVAGCEIGLKRK